MKSNHHGDPSQTCFCSACGAANEGYTICFACHQPLIQKQEDLDTSSSLINERYQLLTLVGSGGFSAVYQARDTRADRLVALKQISLPGLSAQQQIEATETFHREVAILSTLQHPQLPALLDHFSDPEHWYLVMEYIEGETLEQYLLSHSQNYSPLMHNASLPVDEVIRMGQQLCTILEYLHTRTPPIIFRDLKPGNIIRATNGSYSLVDFGIARSFKPQQARDTIPFGSPGYAAPEQYGKAQTSPRSDVYSLGAILHQALSGHDPSETPFQFAPLEYMRVELARLAALIMSMVATKADNRPESVQQVAQELRAIQQELESHEVRLWRPGPAQTPPAVHLVPGGSSWYTPTSGQQGQIQQKAQSSRKSPQRKVFFAGIVLTIFLVISGVLTSLQVNGRAGETTNSTKPPALGQLLYKVSSPGAHCDNTPGASWVDYGGVAITCQNSSSLLTNTSSRGFLQGTFLIELPGIEYPGNYVVEAQLRQDSEPYSRFGLYFRNQPDPQLGVYSFLVQPDGTWGAYVYDNVTGAEKKLTGGPFIYSHASVKLAVEVSGSQFSFFADGTELGSVNDTTYPSGSTGIVVSQGGLVTASDYALYATR